MMFSIFPTGPLRTPQVPLGSPRTLRTPQDYKKYSPVAKYRMPVRILPEIISKYRIPVSAAFELIWIPDAGKCVFRVNSESFNGARVKSVIPFPTLGRSKDRGRYDYWKELSVFENGLTIGCVLDYRQELKYITFLGFTVTGGAGQGFLFCR